MVARVYGAGKVYLVDVGAFANAEIEVYRAAAVALMQGRETLLHPADWTCIQDMLEDCRATYLTDGVASLRSISDGHVDFTWSQAVLEHVRCSDFDETMRELRRICSTRGYASTRSTCATISRGR